MAFRFKGVCTVTRLHYCGPLLRQRVMVQRPWCSELLSSQQTGRKQVDIARRWGAGDRMQFLGDYTLRACLIKLGLLSNKPNEDDFLNQFITLRALVINHSPQANHMATRPPA